MCLTIAHLYPDLFSLYGDKGNILALQQRLKWRGIGCRLTAIGLTEPFQADAYDLVYLGGGLEWQNEILQNDIKDKKSGLAVALAEGTVILAVNGAFWLLGQYLERPDGTKLPGLGILDAWSKLGTKRITGQLVAHSARLAEAGADPKLLGFVNRQTSTWLGPGLAALATVEAGPANNSQQNEEGAIYKNLYCTNILGGLLPLNPELTDYLLEIALKRRFSSFAGLEKLSDSYTENARKVVLACK